MSVSISREKTVFYAALDVADPAQRRQFLDQSCGKLGIPVRLGLVSGHCGWSST